MENESYRTCSKCKKISHVRAGSNCPHCGVNFEVSARTTDKQVLQKKFDQIAKETGDDQFFTKKELHYLPEVLREGEDVLAFSSGLMEGNTWLIALTNKRIIFLDKGMIYGLKQASVDLLKVNAVSGSTGIIFGSISITDGALTRTVKNVPKKTVKHFTNKIHDAIEALHSTKRSNSAQEISNPAETIAKLAALKEQGILTAEEFIQKKQEILSRI